MPTDIFDVGNTSFKAAPVFSPVKLVVSPRCRRVPIVVGGRLDNHQAPFSPLAPQHSITTNEIQFRALLFPPHILIWKDWAQQQSALVRLNGSSQNTGALRRPVQTLSWESFLSPKFPSLVKGILIQMRRPFSDPTESPPIAL